MTTCASTPPTRTTLFAVAAEKPLPVIVSGWPAVAGAPAKPITCGAAAPRGRRDLDLDQVGGRRPGRRHGQADDAAPGQLARELDVDLIEAGEVRLRAGERGGDFAAAEQ